MSGTADEEGPKRGSWRDRIDFQALADGLPALIFICDAAGGCVFTNDQVQAATGLTEKSWLGGGWIAAIHRDDRARVARAWGRAISASEPFELEYRIKTASGDHDWYLVRAKPVREGRRILYWIGHATDIDDRRREGEVKAAELTAEAARELAERRRAEEFAARLIDANADSIKTLSLEGRLLSVNAAGAASMDIGSEEVFLGRNWVEAWPTREGRAAARRAIKAAAGGGVGRFSAPFVTINGERRWWNVAITPMRGAEGEVQSLLCVSRDVTEGREALERLELIARTVREGFYQTDVATGAKLYVSPGYAAIYGRSVREVMARPLAFLDWIHPEDVDRVRAELEREARGEATRSTYRIVRPDGEVRWVRDLCQPVFNEADQVVQVVGSLEDITESRLIEERLSVIANTMTEAIYQIDLVNRRLAYVSPAHETIWGRPAKTYVNDLSTFQQFIHPEDYPTVVAAYGVHAKGETARMEYRILRPDGEVRHIRDLAHPILDAAGRVVQVVGSLEDITEVRQAEERFKLVAESVREGFYMVDIGKGDVLYSNPALDTIWGRPFQDAAGKRFGFLEWVHPEDRIKLLLGVEEVRQGRPTRTTFRIQRPDGSLRHIRDLCQPIFDEAGHVSRAVGAVEDITESLETETRLKLIAETMAEGFYQTDLATGLSLYSSPGCERILGRSTRILEEDPCTYLEWVHPEDRHLVEEAMAREREGEPNRTVYRIVRPDGEIRWVRDLNQPILNERGMPVQTVGTFEDITEIRQVQARAEAASQERYRSVFEQAAVGIARVSLDSRVIEANRRFCEILEWPLDELMAVTAPEIAHPDDFAKAAERTQAMLRGEIPSFTLPMRYRTPAGDWVHARLTVSPAYDAEGRVEHYVSVVAPLEHAETQQASVAA